MTKVFPGCNLTDISLGQTKLFEAKLAIFFTMNSFMVTDCRVVVRSGKASAYPVSFEF